MGGNRIRWDKRNGNYRNKKVNNTIYTAGYKIKVMNSLKDMMNDPDN